MASKKIVTDSYIKMAAFFTDYAPGVKNWKHKLRKVDGNGSAIDFTADDILLINKGLKSLMSDLVKSGFHNPPKGI